jgi:putative N6-adenine-specific DNA methylase
MPLPYAFPLAAARRLWQENRMQLFAVCAPGLEPVLLAELAALDCRGKAVAGGVELEGTLHDVRRLNLWLRTASRVLVRLGEIKATAFPELVRKAQALPWEKFVQRSAQLRVTCRKSRLYHSAAVAERLHAAMQERVGHEVRLEKAPAGEVEGGPQLFVARFEHDLCTVSADSSGALLHQRGYRGPQAKAPLRETLAAALLLAAGYDGTQPLCDPLCGSGTIAIEGALIALKRAPGLRRSFAFQEWPGHDRAAFDALLAAARAGEKPQSAIIEASDQDAGATAAARENAQSAGVEVAVAQRQLAQLPPAEGPGLIACNPPYGVRVGGDVRRLFRELGEALRRRPGWALATLAADEGQATSAGLAFRRLLRTQNGGIPISFLRSP